MKLSNAVLTATTTVSVAASDYSSHCNPSTFDNELCFRQCSYSREVGQTVTREKYGKHSWLYKVFGTEGLSGKKVKKTYRNIIQIQSGDECDDNALLLLKNSLMDNSMTIDIMDGPKDMMSIDYLYSNIGSENALTAGEYDDCDKGLWIQIKRDSSKRDSDTDCVKKIGSKKRDCYNFLLSDFMKRIEGDDAQMEKVNACIESSSVFRMQNSDKDMTKCMSYKSCDKKCDEDCDWPSVATTMQTTTEATAGTTTGTATGTATVEPFHEDLIPDVDLPDFNNFDYDFTCGLDGDDTKCTIIADGMTFNGRLDKETDTVTFLPIKYAEISKRWTPPTLIESYDSPQGSFNQNSKENRPQCMQEKIYDDGYNTEDCLYLKIETPRLALENKTKKSVVMFIHGGGWKKGWGMADGPWNEVGNKSKAVKHQDVMFVSMNYRLNVFGFLHLEDSDEKFKGNWGYQDQIAAMKWVYSFAGLFGGDRDQVTITGWSAGGGAVWNHLANKEAWPYFHRAAPMGASMISWHTHYPKVKNNEQKLWKKVDCDDINCLQTLDAKDLIEKCDDKCYAKSMDQSATVNVPETLFNAFRNGNTRPNTPILWTMACDEFLSKNWYLNDASKYFTADEIKAIEADIADSSNGVDLKMKIPSPYMNTYLERWFGPSLGEEMKTEYGCSDPSVDINCFDEVQKFQMAKHHFCPSIYALRTSYGDVNQSGGANLYPVEFCQHLPDKVKQNDQIDYAYSTCIDKEWDENDNRACHGAEQGYVFGQNHDTDAFGKAVSDAYGSFFRDGVIPVGNDWSLNNLEDANFGMNFLKSAETPDIAGVPLPWTENQHVEIVRDRVAGCAVMDKLHVEYDFYEAASGFAWKDAPGYNDVN